MASVRSVGQERYEESQPSTCQKICAPLPIGAILSFVLLWVGLSTSSAAQGSVSSAIDTFNNGTATDSSSTESLVKTIGLPFTIVALISILGLAAIILSRLGFGQSNFDERPSICNNIANCIASRGILCILGWLSWIMFLVILVLSQVFLLLSILLIMGSLICSGGAQVTQAAEQLLHDISMIPGQHGDEARAQSFVSNLNLNNFCLMGTTLSSSAVTFYVGCLMITVGQAFMASCLNGEHARVEELVFHDGGAYSDE